MTPRRTFLASLAVASCVRAAEPAPATSLEPPAKGRIDVAFVVSNDARRTAAYMEHESTRWTTG